MMKKKKKQNEIEFKVSEGFEKAVKKILTSKPKPKKNSEKQDYSISL